ncbi:MAG: hypothetical protein RH862_06005 [Leptospiraceae bacterium]
MKHFFPALLAFLLIGCQTITIGMNPAPDADAFLETIKQQDIASFNSRITSDVSSKKKVTESLEKLQNADSPASKQARDKVAELKIENCYMGSDRSLCKLNNDSELVLEKDGLGWKVNLKESSFTTRFSEDMQGLFRAEQGPEYVTQQFTIALLEGNLEQAREYSTSRTHMLLPLIVGMMSAAQQDQTEDQKLKIEEAKQQLESMTCEVDGDKAQCAPEGKDKSMNLVRENGVWKVDFRKGGSEEDEKTEGAPTESSAETLEESP